MWEVTGVEREEPESGGDINFYKLFDTKYFLVYNTESSEFVVKSFMSPVKYEAFI